MIISRTGIAIGPLTIHYYGMIFLVAILAGAWLFARLGKARGISTETVWDTLPAVVIPGIIGARLWHVLLPSASSGLTPGYYLSHPLQILAVWNGGLGIPGGILGAAIGLLLFCRGNGFSFADFADSAVPGLALGQAIGRWGNYVNQELYGAPSTLPWAITIDPPYRLPQYMDQATYHPLFLYEMIYNLLNMAALLWIGRKFKDRLHRGDLLLCYLIFYPVGRFLLEFLRLDQARVGDLNMNQVAMAVVAVCAAAALIIRHRKK